MTIMQGMRMFLIDDIVFMIVLFKLFFSHSSIIYKNDKMKQVFLVKEFYYRFLACKVIFFIVVLK